MGLLITLDLQKRVLIMKDLAQEGLGGNVGV